MSGLKGSDSEMVPDKKKKKKIIASWFSEFENKWNFVTYLKQQYNFSCPLGPPRTQINVFE